MTRSSRNFARGIVAAVIFLGIIGNNFNRAFAANEIFKDPVGTNGGWRNFNGFASLSSVLSTEGIKINFGDARVQTNFNSLMSRTTLSPEQLREGEQLVQIREALGRHALILDGQIPQTAPAAAKSYDLRRIRRVQQNLLELREFIELVPERPRLAVERSLDSCEKIIAARTQTKVNDFELVASALRSVIDDREESVADAVGYGGNLTRRQVHPRINRVADGVNSRGETIRLGRIEDFYDRKANFRRAEPPHQFLARDYDDRVFARSPLRLVSPESLRKAGIRIWNAWIAHKISLLSVQTWNNGVSPNNRLGIIKSLVHELKNPKTGGDPMIGDASQAYAFGVAAFSQNEKILLSLHDRGIDLFSDAGPVNPFSIKILHDLARHLRGVLASVKPEDRMKQRLLNAVDYVLIVRHVVSLLEAYRDLAGDFRNAPLRQAVLEAITDALGADPEYLLDPVRFSELQRGNLPPPQKPQSRTKAEESKYRLEYKRYRKAVFPADLPKYVERYFSLLRELSPMLSSDLQELPVNQAVLNWQPGQKVSFYSPFGRSNIFSYYLWNKAVLASMLRPGVGNRHSFQDFNSSSADPEMLRWMRAVDRDQFYGAHDPAMAKSVLEGVLEGLDRFEASVISLSENPPEGSVPLIPGKKIPSTPDAIAHFILRQFPFSEVPMKLRTDALWDLKALALYDPESATLAYETLERIRDDPEDDDPNTSIGALKEMAKRRLESIDEIRAQNENRSDSSKHTTLFLVKPSEK